MKAVSLKTFLRVCFLSTLNEIKTIISRIFYRFIQQFYHI